MIEHLREHIQTEAKRQMINNGYSKTTIRSVANACKIGVGTMYTYFKSKDELISSFMLDDWRICVEQMEKAATADPEAFLCGVQRALSEYIHNYQNVFHDEDAKRAFASVFAKRHAQLRGKIADIISPILERSQYDDKRFLSEHIAESIINWSMEDVPFDRQFSIIQKVII